MKTYVTGHQILDVNGLCLSERNHWRLANRGRSAEPGRAVRVHRTDGGGQRVSFGQAGGPR